MMVDHDKVFAADKKGDFHRQSVTICLVGDPEVDIGWGVNAMAVHLPVNAHRALIVQPHMNIDAARNLAIDMWARAPKATEHLFLWPANSYIEWNTIAEAMATDKPVVKIGQGEKAAYCLRQDALGRTSAPWFKNNTWQGEDDALDLTSKFSLNPEQGEAQYIEQRPPQVSHTATPEQSMVICIPSLGRTSLAWVGHAMQLGGPVATVRYMALMIGEEVAESREKLVSSVLAMEPTPKYLFFYGDDMIPQPNSLILLWDTMQRLNCPIVSGLYMMKTFPPERYLMWNKGKPGLLIPGRDFQVGDQVACDGTGLDFTLIKTDLLKKVPRPHFKTGLEWVEDQGIVVHTEDTFFYDKVRKHTGYKPVIDTRARIAHYNSFDGAAY